MAQETLVLEWEQTKEKLRSPDGDTRRNARQDLMELEEYMVSKGFTFKHGSITDITGETVWERN